MGNVMLIPARRQVGNNARKQEEEKPKLRVAAYCRVSTDSDEQATSYEAQVEHYTEYIQKNPDWEFAGIYADDGISGTNTKKREEFNHMIDDCKAGNIDMIITKSISRFARNTLDCLKYIRQLKDMNIPVLFEKESINTMDAKGEVLITIMASLAQQESQSLSQNVKLGLQYRYQQGKVQINHNRFLGYTKDADGNLIIDPEQAEIVKRIYREYLEGLSMDKIAAGLERDGILTGAGGKKWHTSTINKILRNEKYIGDALLQKTYTTDFLNKTRVKNNGLVPQYYVEGDHEAIIPKDIYLQVQEELVRRRVAKPVLTARNVAIAAITASRKSSSAENAVKCSEGSTGTIVELNRLSGAASAGLNPPDWNATLAPSMSWFFRMLLLKPSIKSYPCKQDCPKHPSQSWKKSRGSCHSDGFSFCIRGHSDTSPHR